MNDQITVRLPAPLLERLDRLADERGTPRSELVRAAIRAYLDGSSASPGHPYELVVDLVGSLEGGPGDLGRRHREYLRERLLGG